MTRALLFSLKTSSAIQPFVLYVHLDIFSSSRRNSLEFDGAALNPHNALVIAVLTIFLQFVNINFLHSSVFSFSLVVFFFGGGVFLMVPLLLGQVYFWMLLRFCE